MIHFECQDCGTDFLSIGATSCPACGSTDISSLPAIASPGANGEAEAASDCIPTIRVILARLCHQVYDCSFHGSEWDHAIDEAVAELRPYLKA